MGLLLIKQDKALYVCVTTEETVLLEATYCTEKAGAIHLR